MVIVRIIGGLGNQMFQYAYARALKHKGYEVKIDISSFKTYKLHDGYGLDKFNTVVEVSKDAENKRYYSDSVFSKILRKIGKKNRYFYVEDNLKYNQNLLNIKDNLYIVGYFQSEKYFTDISDFILKDFTFKLPISNFCKDIASKINLCKNSCSLHVRRGDFIDKDNINIHGSCSIEYYQKAMQYLEERKGKIKYFIFSDDIKWVRHNLKIANATYVTCKKSIVHEDMYLMSLCSCNIIANSSFSWWGAWLNQNKNKIVIAPKTWFMDEGLEKQSSDIVCKDWIKI